MSTVLKRSADPAPQERQTRRPNRYAAYVLGAAFFDLDGLPQTCLNTTDVIDLNWVQTTFEALRLQSLLGCWLQLRGAEHVTIRGHEYNIVLVRQCDRYVGVLIKPDAPDLALKALVQWAKEFRRRQA